MWTSGSIPRMRSTTSRAPAGSGTVTITNRAFLTPAASSTRPAPAPPETDRTPPSPPAHTRLPPPRAPGRRAPARVAEDRRKPLFLRGLRPLRVPVYYHEPLREAIEQPRHEGPDSTVPRDDHVVFEPRLRQVESVHALFGEPIAPPAVEGGREACCERGERHGNHRRRQHDGVKFSGDRARAYGRARVREG